VRPDGTAEIFPAELKNRHELCHQIPGQRNLLCDAFCCFMNELNESKSTSAPSAQSDEARPKVLPKPAIKRLKLPALKPAPSLGQALRDDSSGPLASGD